MGKRNSNKDRCRCIICQKFTPVSNQNKLCLKCSENLCASQNVNAEVIIDNTPETIIEVPHRAILPEAEATHMVDVTSPTEDATVNATVMMCCENCCRDTIGKVAVQMYIDDGNFKFRKVLCIMKKKRGIDQRYDLCMECYTMLRLQGYHWSSCWPAFFWFLLRQADNLDAINYMWARLLPESLRQTWRRSFQELSNMHFEINADNSNAPILQDITPVVEELNSLRSSQTYANFNKWSDKVHRCTVKCPWGCCEFADQVGYIAYHKYIYYKLHTELNFPLEESSIKVTNRYGKRVNFIGMVQDYFMSPSFYLDSEKYLISPSLEIVEGIGLMMCTCKFHDKGSNMKYLHPPKNPVTKTEAVSVGDPIGHVCIAPRTVTTIKTKNKCSTTYQMQQCNSGFAGTDCCDVKEIGEWHKDNEMSRKNATLAYFHRQDIKSRVQQLMTTKVAPSSYEDLLVCEAQKLRLFENPMSNKITKARTRATRIDLLDALKINHHEVNAHKCDNVEPTWPTVLALCHPTEDSLAGVQPLDLPTSTNFNYVKNDFRLLFIILTMATSVPQMWECLVQSVSKETDSVSWHGFFLTYAHHFVLKYCGDQTHTIIRKKHNPYQFSTFGIDENSMELAFKMQYHSQRTWDSKEKKVPDKSWKPKFTNSQLFDIVNSINSCVIVQHPEEVRNCIQNSTSVLIVNPSCNSINLSTIINEEVDGVNYTFMLAYCGSAHGVSTGFACAVDTAVFNTQKFGDAQFCYKMNASSYKATYGSMEEYLKDTNVIALYIRIDEPNSEHLRKQYLSFLGNRSNITCPRHKCLLVSKPLLKEDKCHHNIISKASGTHISTRCSKLANYRCPIRISEWETCSFMVCKSCNEAKQIATPRQTSEASTGNNDKCHNRKRSLHTATLMKKNNKRSTNIAVPRHGTNITKFSAVAKSTKKSTISKSTKIAVPRHDTNGENTIYGTQALNWMQWLSSNNLKIVCDYKYTVGNCLYDSVSFILDNGVDGKMLRELCYAWNTAQVEEDSEWGIVLQERYEIFNHQLRYEAEFHTDVTDSIQQFLEKGRDFRRYAGQLDIVMLSAYLNRPFAIYSEPTTVGNYTAIEANQNMLEVEVIKIWFDPAGQHYQPLVQMPTIREVPHHGINLSAIQVDDASQYLSTDDSSEELILCDDSYVSDHYSTLHHDTKHNVELESKVHCDITCDSTTSTDILSFSDCNTVQSMNDDSIILPPFLDVMTDDMYNAEDSYGRSDDSMLSSDNCKKIIRATPSTNAATTAKHVSLDATNSSEFKMNMHVLLNAHGSCLNRSNRPITTTKRQKQFLEGIVATSEGQSIPLLYPEAMLFPDIFWNQHKDGSYEGAIPVPFMTEDSVPESYGYASITDHLITRITSPDLLCSTKPEYLFYAFDILNNLSSNGIDSRLLLKRGHEHMYHYVNQTKRGKRIQNNTFYSEGLLSSDSVDTRRTVRNLSAMIKENEPTWFYTHTCNMLKHPGIRILKEILQEKLDELEDRKLYIPQVDYEEKVKALHHMSVVQTTRTWMKISRQYMHYIINSHEQPLGKVTDFFWRYEFQDASGNLPHIHCLLWTKEDKYNPEDLQKLQDKVRCSSTHFFFDDGEFDALVEEGIISSSIPHWQMEDELLKEIMHIQNHSCAGSKFRCHRRVGRKKTDVKCRVPDYYEMGVLPTKHGFKKISPKHSKEATQLFIKLGLFTEDGEPNHPKFKTGKYTYPARKGEKFSPCNNRLWVGHHSSDNLLMVSPYFTTRYLAKYAAGIDENCKLRVKAGKTKDSLKLVEEVMQNTKISSSRIIQKEVAAKKGVNPAYTAKAIGIPEVITAILGEQQVFFSRAFEHIPSVTFEDRPAEVKDNFPKLARDKYAEQYFQRHPHIDPMGSNLILFIGKQIRNDILQLPEERRFTKLEEVLIESSLSSEITLDKITKFGCRPPELRFIPKPEVFWTCFTTLPHKKPDEHRGTTTEQLLHESIFSCGWVNGMDCQIKVRPKGIQKILHLEECQGQTRHLFELLNYECYGIIPPSQCHLTYGFTNAQLQSIVQKFVDESYGLEASLPIPVYNMIKPWQTNRFLIHVLLSLGEYSNEAELFNGVSPKQWFRNAKLIPGDSDDEVSEENIKSLTRKVILEDLIFLPTGTIAFGKACIAAHEAFRMALLEDYIKLNILKPTYLLNQLIQEADEKCKKFMTEIKEGVVNAVSQLPRAPSKQSLMAATVGAPVQNYTHELVQVESQSDESFNECSEILQYCKNNIDNYMSLECVANNVIINGAPGCGKTFQMLMAGLYALTKGLTIAVTALISDRALQLGGRHLHNLFCLPVIKHGNVQIIADKAIRSLMHNPIKVALIVALHMLLIDELGNIPAEYLCALDIVFRYFRKNSAYMGGVLILCTMDHKQLPPIKATPALMSTLLRTNFKMKLMKFSIRAVNDANLRALINISRLNASFIQAMIHEFKEIVITKCNHVQDWNSAIIPKDAVRILGKRSGVNRAEDDFFTQLQKTNTTVRYRFSEDIQTASSLHGNWKQAEAFITQQLNRLVNEVHQLRLYKNMIVEFTCNKEGVHSNGQMGILLDLPEQAVLDSWLPFEVIAAPHGVKNLPSTVAKPNSKEDLINNYGWKSVMVRHCPETSKYLYRGISAKRKQYSIRHRLATTIHKGMGSEYGKVVTKVTTKEDDSGFNLWMKEQVIVLISRTHSCNDLTFVGHSPQDTANILCSLLTKTSPLEAYMDHIVNNMTGSGEEAHVLHPLRYLPYNLHQHIIPVSSTGYVYCIMSMRDRSHTYIGCTINLKRRIEQHNTISGGSNSTRDVNLKPWGCIGFVVGFDDKITKERFEAYWQRNRNRQGQHILGPVEVIRLGQSLVANYRERFQTDLVFIQCFEFKLNP